MHKVFTHCSLVLTGMFLISISSTAQEHGTKGVPEVRVTRPAANEKAETKTSKEFDGTIVTWTRDTSNSKLGEAWRHPTGLVWGDIVKNEDGSPRSMNHKDATDYCKSIGAELPSQNDFLLLRDYMGANYESYKGYTPQVLPNLTYIKGGETSSRYFWSSTPHLSLSSLDDKFFDDGSSYIFDGRTGITFNDKREKDLNIFVRCIVKNLIFKFPSNF